MTGKGFVNSTGEYHRRALAAVLRISNIIGYLTVDLSEILQAVLHEIRELVGPSSARILLLNGTDLKASEEADCPASGADPAQCRAMVDRLPYVVTDTRVEVPCHGYRGNPRVRSHLCIPIASGEELVGVFSANSPEPMAFTREGTEIIFSIINQVFISVKRNELHLKLAQEKEALKRVNEDISQLNSELLQKIEMIKAMQSQLIQTEKLAATGRLAAEVAHEINNPIGIIISRLELMSAEIEEGVASTLTDDVEVVRRQAERIATFVRSLLAFNRENPLQKERLSLNQTIRETLRLFPVLGLKVIELQVNLWEDLPEIYGDPHQLQQVFLNIILNALDALAGGGQLSITARVENGGVLTVVADNGIGISPETLTKVFDPFFTTKSSERGTGLGLSIAYGLVQGHGGRLWLESQVGVGTKVFIWLPGLMGG